MWDNFIFTSLSSFVVLPEGAPAICWDSEDPVFEGEVGFATGAGGRAIVSGIGILLSFNKF